MTLFLTERISYGRTDTIFVYFFDVKDAIPTGTRTLGTYRDSMLRQATDSSLTCA